MKENFSLVSENDDIKIFKLARSSKEDIIPCLPKWIEDKLTKEFKLNLQKKLSINIRSTEI